MEKRTCYKLRKIIIYNFYHSVTVLIVTIFMLLLKSSFNKSIVIVSLTIFITHFVADVIKSGVSKLKKPMLNFYTLFIDQVIHLSIIAFLWMNFSIKSDGIISFIINMFHNDKVRHIILNYNMLSYRVATINLILFLIVLIYVTLGGDVVIRSVLVI